MDRQYFSLNRDGLSSSILVYDGDCGFCNFSLNFLYKHMDIMPAAEPYQSAELNKLGLALTQVEESVYLVTPSRKLSGHRAIAQLLLWQNKYRYRFIGQILATKLLSKIWQWSYILVAKNRRYLPGATAACGIKKPKLPLK